MGEAIKHSARDRKKHITSGLEAYSCKATCIHVESY